MVNVWALEVPPPGDGLTTVTLAVPAVAMSAAVIVAVISVSLTKVVVRFEPFHCTWLLATKFVPFTVKVNDPPPAVALGGESDLVVGIGLSIVNVSGADVPPPGAGLVTVTMAVPAVAMSAAVIMAVTFVAFTKVLVRLDPFQFTIDVETKLVPVTVRVKAAPPAVVLLGESAVAVGLGLSTVNVTALEVPPPPGFITVTGNVPARAISATVIIAVTFLLLTNVVVLAEPFHCTIDVLAKFVPFTVRVTAEPPAVALLG